MNFAGQLTTKADVETFLFAGNATLTLKSKKSGDHFTYRVRVSKGDIEKKVADPVYFVSLLNGPDNESDFQYMGIMRRSEGFKRTTKSKVGPDAVSMKGWVWFIASIQTVLPGNVEVWHEGRCGRCGRKLTVPESIAQGLGPECAGKM